MTIDRAAIEAAKAIATGTADMDWDPYKDPPQVARALLYLLDADADIKREARADALAVEVERLKEWREMAASQAREWRDAALAGVAQHDKTRAKVAAAVEEIRGLDAREDAEPTPEWMHRETLRILTRHGLVPETKP